MERVLKVHHYGVSRLAKALSRRSRKWIMEQPPKPTHRRVSALEVHVMFEPSRLAQQTLQDAYACVIPTVRRRLGQTALPKPSRQSKAERKAQ
jgi:hypothetical protein